MHLKDNGCVLLTDLPSEAMRWPCVWFTSAPSFEFSCVPFGLGWRLQWKEQLPWQWAISKHWSCALPVYPGEALACSLETQQLPVVSGGSLRRLEQDNEQKRAQRLCKRLIGLRGSQHGGPFFQPRTHGLLCHGRKPHGVLAVGSGLRLFISWIYQSQLCELRQSSSAFCLRFPIHKLNNSRHLSDLWVNNMCDN